MSHKHEIARTSFLASTGLMLAKLSVGIFTGSLALISDGVHAALDVLATFITMVAVHVSDRPADETHNYGHNKIENISAFGEALLLFVAAGAIVWRSIEEIFHHDAPPRHVAWAIAVVSAAIVVDVWRGIRLSLAAKTFESKALAADAVHFKTDLLASGAVLCGLIIVHAAGPKWHWVDAAAALAVAAIMVYAAIGLARQSIDILMDRAPAGLEPALQEVMRRVPGVTDVLRVRARQSGPRRFVDATISVDAKATLAEGHRIASAAELAVSEHDPRVDLTIHVEPGDADAGPTTVIHELAQTMKLQVHAVRVHEVGGQQYVSFHVELAGDMPLQQAHSVVSELEKRIRARLPNVSEVNSHLEPLP